MKTFLKDASQILAALLITGSMVYANALPPQVVKNDTVALISTESLALEPQIAATPIETPKAAETAPTQLVEPEPVVEQEYVPSGNQYIWLNSSGIPREYWRAVDYIVSRESKWKPCAYYPSKNDCSAQPTGACGLVQQNPCGKIPGDWRDPVAALKWADAYVKDRYGGWPGAYNHWLEFQSY